MHQKNLIPGKRSNSFRLVALFVFVAPMGLQAQVYWTGISEDQWGTAANWTSDKAGTTAYGQAPQTGDILVFHSDTAAAGNQTVNNNMVGLSIGGIDLNRNTALTINGNAFTLTGGINLVSGATGASNITINAGIILGADTSWTHNNQGATFNLNGLISETDGPRKIILPSQAGGGSNRTINFNHANNTFTGGIEFGNRHVVISNAQGALGSGELKFLNGGSNTSLQFSTVAQTVANTINLNGQANARVHANALTIHTGTMAWGTNGSLDKQGSSILHLAGAATGTGGTTISGGGLFLAGMDRIAGGNLNINAGVFVFNGTTGTGNGSVQDFTTARGLTTGTDAGEWQLGTSNNAGFASRNNTAVLGAGFGSASNFFDRNFTLGSTVRDNAGNLFANAGVTIDQSTTLTADRTITLAATGVSFGGKVSHPEYRINGLSGAGAPVFVANANLGSGNPGPGNRNAEVVLGGTNHWTGGRFVALNGNASSINTGAGGLLVADNNVFVRFANNAALPTGNDGNTAHLAALRRNVEGGGWGFMLTGGDTYELPTGYRFLIGGERTGSFGSSGGDATLVNSAIHAHRINNQNPLDGNGVPGGGMIMLVRDGMLTLGTAGNPVTLASSFNEGTGGSDPQNATAISLSTGNVIFSKFGEGTLDLANIVYAGANADAVGQFRWILAEGAVRADAHLMSTDGTGTALELRGGVLEANGSFTRALGTGRGQFRFNSGSTHNGAVAEGGGGFSAHGGDLTVNIGGAAASFSWAATNFVPNNTPLIFGSQTADGVVTFENGINFNNALREIRVQAGRGGDKAVISGNLTGTGSSGFLKTGDGVLELTGINTYLGGTFVNGGILLINGNHSAATGAVTVAAGGTLGGSGRIGGAILGAGLVSPGNSPGIFTAVSVTGSEGTDFAFEFGQIGAPTWSAAAASGNDVLRL
ncbi:MAG: autotransporter-associated beta strand repeat-containing protein, partial [Verrucomicrobia bacterium]|nr:autotransporter-associated beta strand repeat-containing protein [Verrucomicrobiota bacterium]